MRKTKGKRSVAKRRITLLAIGAVIIGVVMGASAPLALAYYNVTIGAASTNGSWTGNVWTPSGSGSTVAVAEIETRLAAGVVAITTGSSGSGAEAGNIGVNTGVTWSANILTLNGAGTITINAAMNGSDTSGLALQYGQGAVAAGNTSTYTVKAPVNLASTGSFSTKLGSDGVVKNYTILISLGAAGSVTATDLQGMNGNLAGNYVLGANIDATATSGWNAGAGFSPVGDSSTKFTGIFDGLGHTISNLTINRPSTDYVGLFGYTSGATLRNVGLTNANITGRSSMGVLAGTASNTSIGDSYATGQISGAGSLGGLVGFSTASSITRSYAVVAVSGTSIQIGGLVGANNTVSTISASYATGSVSGTGNTGGLVGTNRGAVTTSYSTGLVVGSGLTIGGLVGVNTDAGGGVGAVSNSYWDTGTSGQASGVGSNNGMATFAATGLATSNAYTQANYANLDFTNTWWMSDGTTRPFLRSEYSTTIANAHQLQMMAMNLTSSYSLASDIDASETSVGTGMWNSAGFVPGGDAVTKFTGIFDGLGHTVIDLYINRPATEYVGLFGYADAATLRNVGLLNATVTGKNGVGTLVGIAWTNSVIDNSYATGTVSGSGGVGTFQFGGLAGRVNCPISNSHAAVVVTGNSEVGGLVGRSAGAISNSYATGNVSGTSYVGGLAGSHVVGSIANSYATGNVSGTGAFAGGLVGVVDGTGAVSNSYATGAVSGNSEVGGLVGYFDVLDASVANSYAIGAVSGTSVLGGLVGVLGDGTVTASYWDTQASGQATSAGGTGKTTAEMKSLATFAGWDIDDAGGTGKVWRIYDGYTNPLLRGFMTTLNAQPNYDGSGAALTNVGAYTISGAYDPAKVLGAVANRLTLSSTAANGYTARLSSGLYSTQQGYDLVTQRTIATPGSAAGDIALTNPVAWTGGILAINTAGTVTDTAAISGTGTAVFLMQAGTWRQVNASLPAFAAHDFRIFGGTFVRALSGDGSSMFYQLADIYGIQGMGSSGMPGLGYQLANDVDATGTANWNGGAGFVPVGTPVIRFTGVFDGQGHTITGLTINRPAADYVGLFGIISSATLRNAGLLNCDVTGRNSVGALAGASLLNALIDNSDAAGTVHGALNVGGLVGNTANSVAVINSHAGVDVSGSDNSVGGLVGNSSGTIDNSSATGAVTGNARVGGLAGSSDNTVSRSYATGAVGGSSTFVGGLLGYLSGSGFIGNGYATGTVTGGSSVGGLVGETTTTTTAISNSYATGSVTGIANLGGLAGTNYGTITTSYAIGAVNGGGINLGGLIGASSGTVTACFWDMTVTPLDNGIGIGKTTAEMQSLATFSGWSIDDAGGTGAIWRIYNGHTTPFLRPFLTPLTVTADNVGKSYDGVPYTSPLSNPAYSVPGAVGSGHLFNLANPYQGAVEVGSYLPALWSDQQGYDITYLDALLTISKANQTINFAPLPDHTYGDADFVISATASSGLAVSFASTTPGVCTVSGTLVSLVAPGICSITASQGGDVHYNPAVDVSRGFMVQATVTPSAGPNGSISPDVPQVVAYNSTASFTIVPAIGYHVAAVGGTCGGSYTGDPADSVNGILYITNAVIADCTVQASFAINQYSVAAIAGLNGSLDPATPSPQTVEHGATTQFTFHADTDYFIASITGCGITYLNGDQSITTRSETTPPITGDCTVTATFASNTHQLTVIVQGKGRVTSDSSGIDCPGTCAGTYDHNAIVTLTPTPEQGGKFAGWSGDADCEDGVVTMTADLTCTAKFSQFRWWIFWPAVMQAIQQSQQGTAP